MDEMRRRRWAWKARKWGLSTFCIAQITATVIWCLPACPVKAAALPWLEFYMMPTGQWQYWGMFAPDPATNSFTLEADVVDSRGLRATFAFPRLADYSLLGGVARFRHSKYAANLNDSFATVERELAARYVVRQLGIPESAFPVDVNLIYQLRVTPPPGGPPADPMAPTRTRAICTIHFTKPWEVRQ
jgi:hypothetical protein